MRIFSLNINLEVCYDVGFLICFKFQQCESVGRLIADRHDRKTTTTTTTITVKYAANKVRGLIMLIHVSANMQTVQYLLAIFFFSLLIVFVASLIF